MNEQLIAHLSAKYGVPASIIRTLMGLSRIWQAQTGEHAARTLRLYNKIVAAKCGGIDPLV